MGANYYLFRKQPSGEYSSVPFPDDIDIFYGRWLQRIMHEHWPMDCHTRMWTTAELTELVERMVDRYYKLCANVDIFPATPDDTGREFVNQTVAMWDEIEARLISDPDWWTQQHPKQLEDYTFGLRLLYYCIDHELLLEASC